MIERRREGAVELLRLDRQAVRNALDAALAAEIAREKAAPLQAAHLAGLPPAAVASTKRFFAQLAGADELDRLAVAAYQLNQIKK